MHLAQGGVPSIARCPVWNAACAPSAGRPFVWVGLAIGREQERYSPARHSRQLAG